jgi:hypothetical protein
MKKLLAAIIIFCYPVLAFPQVSQIKSASSNHSSRSTEGGRYSDGSGVLVDIMFNVVFGEIIRSQQTMLERRHEVPMMCSAELILQTAVQPSAYYLVNPRLRASWGLFSTDFRFNYLVEEGIDETIHLRTNDWQVLQLNLLSTRDFGFRIGGGIIHESFGEKKTFGEWTTAFQIHSITTRLGGTAEYRHAEVRREINAAAQYRIFDRDLLHGFLTAGIVYQKYYHTIAVWGMQGGVLFKVY